MSEAKHTTVRLYYHKTDGGEEYLTDKFVKCPNGHKEGIFEGANYIVRLDGKPELTIRDSQADAAPDLLEACKAARDHADGKNAGDYLGCIDAAIRKAEGRG